MYAIFGNIIELGAISEEMSDSQGLSLAAMWVSTRPLAFALVALNLLGLLVMCIDSDPKENRYGPNPKAVTSSEHPDDE